MSDQQGQLQEAGRTFKEQVFILGGFVALFWLLEIVDRLFLNGALDGLGIKPRTAAGLWGIALAPFLHIGFGHVAANSIPFLVLGWFVMLDRQASFWLVTGVTAVVSGLGVWLFAPSNSVHLGASGLIFGYFGFLLLRGYFERSLKTLSLSLLALFLYGSMVWGVLPLRVGVSWQGHLFGFIGGGLAAFWLSDRKRKPTRPSALEDEIEIL